MGVYGDVLHERRKQKKGKTLDRRTAELGNQSLRGAFRSFKVHSGSLHCIQVVTIAAPHLNVLLSDTLPSCAHSASQNHVAARDNQYTLCQISSSLSVFRRSKLFPTSHQMRARSHTIVSSPEVCPLIAVMIRNRCHLAGAEPSGSVQQHDARRPAQAPLQGHGVPQSSALELIITTM